VLRGVHRKTVVSVVMAVAAAAFVGYGSARRDPGAATGTRAIGAAQAVLPGFAGGNPSDPQRSASVGGWGAQIPAHLAGFANTMDQLQEVFNLEEAKGTEDPQAQERLNAKVNRLTQLLGVLANDVSQQIQVIKAAGVPDVPEGKAVRENILRVLETLRGWAATGREQLLSSGPKRTPLRWRGSSSRSHRSSSEPSSAQRAPFSATNRCWQTRREWANSWRAFRPAAPCAKAPSARKRKAPRTRRQAVKSPEAAPLKKPKLRKGKACGQETTTSTTEASSESESTENYGKEMAHLIERLLREREGHSR